MKKNTFCYRIFTMILSFALILSCGFVLPINAVDDVELSANSEKATIVEEDSFIRGAYEKHFFMSDGTVMATTYVEPVYYQDNGEWLEVDNTLTLSNGVYRNANNKQFSVEFSQNASNDNMVSVSKDGYSLSWTLSIRKSPSLSGKITNNEIIEKAESITIMPLSTATVQVNNNDSLRTLSQVEQKYYSVKADSKIQYNDVFGTDTAIDVKYRVSHNKLKEDIIFNKVSDVSSVVVTIDADELEASLNADNTVSFRDSLGDLIFTMAAPFMYDAAGEYLYNIDVNLIDKSGVYIMVITPDYEWVKDESRVYPIVLDPTVYAGTGSNNWVDTYVHEDDSAGDYYEDDYLKVGYIDNCEYVSYVKSLSLPNIPSNAPICYAELTMMIYHWTSSGGPFSIYRVTSDWSDDSIEYSNQPTSVLLESGVACETSYYNDWEVNFDITSAIKGYSAGTMSNYGYMIKYTQESDDYNYFYSSDYVTSDTTKRGPVIKVLYNRKYEQEDNDTPANAHSLVLSPYVGRDSYIYGFLTQDDLVDYYKFVAPRHGRVEVLLFYPSSSEVYNLAISTSAAPNTDISDYTFPYSTFITKSLVVTKGTNNISSYEDLQTYYIKVSTPSTNNQSASYRLFVYYMDDYRSLDWTYPIQDVSKDTISSTLGYRTIGNVLDYHKGIDLPGTTNDTIRSICAGTIIAYDNRGDTSAGKFVKVRANETDPVTGKYIIITYMHLSSIDNGITTGQISTLTQGQSIGKMGATGLVVTENGTGVHLHIQIATVPDENGEKLTDFIHPVDIFELDIPFNGEVY